MQMIGETLYGKNRRMSERQKYILLNEMKANSLAKYFQNELFIVCV